MSSHNNTKIVKTSINEDGILRIILDNPKSHNTLSEDMMSGIQIALDEAKIDDKVRVIIISAIGPTFSAGHDLKELRLGRQNKDKGKAYFKPIIAEVAGVATAAGCQLVASCDFAYATASSRFATPGVNIGLFCSTPMVALSRNISNKHSMEMLLTGDFISSLKAAQIGLINESIKEEELETFVLDKALKISKKSAMTLKTGKEAFYKQVDMSLSEAYDFTSIVMVENMLKLDAEEGINAFIEKRTPNWQDK